MTKLNELFFHSPSHPCFHTHHSSRPRLVFSPFFPSLHFWSFPILHLFTYSSLVRFASLFFLLGLDHTRQLYLPLFHPRSFVPLLYFTLLVNALLSRHRFGCLPAHGRATPGHNNGDGGESGRERRKNGSQCSRRCDGRCQGFGEDEDLEGKSSSGGAVGYSQTVGNNKTFEQKVGVPFSPNCPGGRTGGT